MNILMWLNLRPHHCPNRAANKNRSAAETMAEAVETVRKVGEKHVRRVQKISVLSLLAT